MRYMKNLYLLLVCFGVTALATGRVEEKTFEVSGDVRLSLECHKGKVHIRTGDVSAVTMKARVYLSDEGADPASMDYLKIVTRSGEDYVSIDVEYDRSAWDTAVSGLVGNKNIMPAVDFDIVMPDGGSLDIESHKASLDVEAPSGRVKIETHKGNGEIRKVRNEMELETHKGTFRVEILELGGLEIETHKGDVTFDIHNATDFTVRGETRKGNFSFKGYDIPVESVDRREHRVSHSVGNGQNRIDMESHKGDITLNFIND